MFCSNSPCAGPEQWSSLFCVSLSPHTLGAQSCVLSPLPGGAGCSEECLDDRPALKLVNPSAEHLSCQELLSWRTMAGSRVRGCAVPAAFDHTWCGSKRGLLLPRVTIYEQMPVPTGMVQGIDNDILNKIQKKKNICVHEEKMYRGSFSTLAQGSRGNAASPLPFTTTTPDVLGVLASVGL
ncbi:hypothetical protein DV515_00006445, partial [Chloebia gouldiae]